VADVKRQVVLSEDEYETMLDQIDRIPALERKCAEYDAYVDRLFGLPSASAGWVQAILDGKVRVGG
jgi:hypothetical protein